MNSTWTGASTDDRGQFESFASGTLTASSGGYRGPTTLLSAAAPTQILDSNSLKISYLDMSLAA